MANQNKIAVTVRTSDGDTIRVTLTGDKVTAFWENLNNLLMSKNDESKESITSF